MKKNHAVLSYALLMLGLVTRPVQADASALPLEQSSDSGKELIFTEEPEETVTIDHGSYDVIRIEYACSDSSLDCPVVITGEASVSLIQVICGNVRIATDAPVDTLMLGDVVKETDSDWSDVDVLQHVELYTDVHNLQVLQNSTSVPAYCDGSYFDDSFYKSYTGSLILSSGCRIDEVSVFEYYCDIFSGEETALVKEHGFFPEECFSSDSDTELFCDGAWNDDIFPCEKVADWLDRYESRYTFDWHCIRDASGKLRFRKRAYENGVFRGSVLLSSDFDPELIPYDDEILIDTDSFDFSSGCPNAEPKVIRILGKDRRVTVRSGSVMLDGDVKQLVISDRFDPSSGGCAVDISVNGSIDSLTLLGDCANVTLSVTGEVRSGCQTAVFSDDQTMEMIYFRKDADGVSSIYNSSYDCPSDMILFHGTWNPAIYFYADPECCGVGFQMNGVLSEQRDNIYRRNNAANLGCKLYPFVADEPLSSFLTEQSFTQARLSFSFVLQNYEKSEDGLFLCSSPVITKADSPVNFSLLLPDGLVQTLTGPAASASMDFGRNLLLIQISDDALSGSFSYSPIDYTLDGTVLRFASDCFTPFMLVWVDDAAEVPVIPMPEPEADPEDIVDVPVIPVSDIEDIPAVPGDKPVFEIPVSPVVPGAASASVSEAVLIPMISKHVSCHAPVTGDPLLASCGLFSLPFTILFLLFGIPGVCVSYGTFLLIPDDSDSSLTLYEVHGSFRGISLDEYWSFDLLHAYTNPKLHAWDDHLIVFYQDDRYRLPQVYVEMDTDEDWIDLGCPARGKNASLEIIDDQIYVYTAREIYVCDATDPLAGWECMERTGKMP